MPLDTTTPEYIAIQKEWTRVEDFNNGLLIPNDSGLDTARKTSEEAGLPDIAVSPNEGRFLYLLAKSIGARRCIELGTLGGYSTIWLARAVPLDGHVVTFELHEHHAKVAQKNFHSAGVSEKISLILGSARETLPKYESKEKFDLAFVDADKESSSLYFKELKRLVRKGGVIIVDNVVRRGKVADGTQLDSSSSGVRDIMHVIRDDHDVEATVINTVGSKGYDGFMMVYVK
ncbi:O-methyltransferase-domain-containing protein [Crepidotus variabilis]|uniref:O-methyltransferase-domain-containing protein n=1 Tax=Crepidotus variabilis TaxID=179855 RepID=A0A9P6ELH9_9AGAR|nr:O-methyltransferase-domain-containing protein [Crepidotus variabilis]